MIPTPMMAMSNERGLLNIVHAPFFVVLGFFFFGADGVFPFIGVGITVLLFLAIIGVSITLGTPIHVVFFHWSLDDLFTRCTFIDFNTAETNGKNEDEDDKISSFVMIRCAAYFAFSSQFLAFPSTWS